MNEYKRRKQTLKKKALSLDRWRSCERVTEFQSWNGSNMWRRLNDEGEERRCGWLIKLTNEGMGYLQRKKGANFPLHPTPPVALFLRLCNLLSLRKQEIECPGYPPISQSISVSLSLSSSAGALLSLLCVAKDSNGNRTSHPRRLCWCALTKSASPSLNFNSWHVTLYLPTNLKLQV